jgi:bifunctional UDP-N-acetylglucosamine pyrophosphorylase/glucosamine-1-phosphate N-acetyltransferase
MAKTPTAAIVLAAGLGTRMKSDGPKVMHPLAGRPMLCEVLDQVARLKPARTVVVVGPGMPALEALARSHKSKPRIAVQQRRRGTADAVKAALPALGGFKGDVVVTYGDTPLLRAETFRRMLAARRRKDDPAVVLLGFRPLDYDGYGRLVFDADGALAGVVEQRDLTAAGAFEAEWCNAGVMAVDGRRLPGLIAKVRPGNAKKEYYLTDLVALARKAGHPCAMVEGDPEEPAGVNTRLDLAYVEELMQDRLRAEAMDRGATLLDPATVYFSHDTRLGRDVTVGPSVVFGPGVTVGEGTVIRAFSHIEGARIGAGAVVGPFARLRPGADIGAGAHIGNFVEIKAARIGRGAKANHLAYIGDARVGADANIGAGAITCNYDGFGKYVTEIGAGAFIGSNAALVAPVRIGDGAVVGAGSVITENVEADALALTRSNQRQSPGWAARRRRRSAAGRNGKKKSGRKKKA